LPFSVLVPLGPMTSISNSYSFTPFSFKKSMSTS
jgi:hypothetical protein